MGGLKQRVRTHRMSDPDSIANTKLLRERVDIARHLAPMVDRAAGGTPMPAHVERIYVARGEQFDHGVEHPGVKTCRVGE